MQPVTNTWKYLWASGNALLEVKAVIDGTDRSAEVCTAPVINRATTQNGLSVGNVVSATCMLMLRTSASIARSAAVEVEMRLTDGSTTSEWRPAGTFYISRRTKDPVTGLLTLECYDALLKANAVWTPSAGAWPRSMSAVVRELASLIGVSVDSRTTLITGNDYVIDEPTDGTTIRDTLSNIGACNGGNWIITPDGKLRLVPMEDAADAEDAVNAVDVVAVLSQGTVGNTDTITGVRCTVDGMVTLTGDDTGIVVDVGIAPVIAADLAQTLIGMTHQPFRLPSAVYDPAVELGDYVRYGDTVAGVLCAETVTLSQGPRGELCAPDPAELADEYPYIGGAEKALTLAKAYAREAMESLDDDLTQQEIFNRLTDNGAAQGMVLLNGQLYVNASYIRSGTLVLGGLNNVNGTMEVLDAGGNVVGTVTKNGFYAADTVNGAVRSATLADGMVFFKYDGQNTGRLLSGSTSGADYLLINGPDSSGSNVLSALDFWGDGSAHLAAGDQVAALDLHADGSIGINSSDDISATADGDISETAGGTLHLHSGGDASLYLTAAGNAELRSASGAAALILKPDGSIEASNSLTVPWLIAKSGGRYTCIQMQDINGVPRGYIYLDGQTGRIFFRSINPNVAAADVGTIYTDYSLPASDLTTGSATYKIAVPQTQNVTATTDSNGNISLGLAAASYHVLSAKSSSRIVTPWVSGDDGNWHARVTAVNGNATASTSVTVTVIYTLV